MEIHQLKLNEIKIMDTKIHNISLIFYGTFYIPFLFPNIIIIIYICFLKKIEKEKTCRECFFPQSKSRESRSPQQCSQSPTTNHRPIPSPFPVLFPSPPLRRRVIHQPPPMRIPRPVPRLSLTPWFSKNRPPPATELPSRLCAAPAAARRDPRTSRSQRPSLSPAARPSRR